MTAHGHNRRRALVVGGSTGIGRGVAQAWAEEGLDVLVLSRSAPSGPGSDRLRWLATDLTDAAQVSESLALAADQPLHAVCYSAVHYGDRRALFRDCTEAEWRRQIDVNLHGLWLTLSRTLPALRRADDPGVFLGVSSEVVYNAGPGRSGYAASKAAGAALLDSLAQEESTEAPGAEALRVVAGPPPPAWSTPRGSGAGARTGSTTAPTCGRRASPRWPGSCRRRPEPDCTAPTWWSTARVPGTR
ncbi:SDR family NAD(P)-dependent oxidoreductase [Streptomyces tricolor]|nr:SDR family NAD(P)-dependent oxidoreductase [Streptomyces tricolor]